VARYYTPTGRSIQKPYKKGNEEYFKESEARIKSGELYAKDSIKVADSLKFKTPKGRIVYGGGGIVPDVFVPMEAEHGNENVAYLLQTGVVGHFVFEELDKNRNAFSGLYFNAFLSKMKKSEVYFKKFKNYIFMTGLDLKLDKTKDLVNRYIAAEFARQLYGELYYYDVILKEDAMIKKVLNVKK
jgi:carboxyl-terminal processing protease